MLLGTVEREEGLEEGKSSARRWGVVVKARSVEGVVDIDDDFLENPLRPEPSSRTLASMMCVVVDRWNEWD